MSTELNAEELAVIHDTLAELAGAGKEAEVRAYLKEQLPRLPENMQKEIMARSYFDALVEEADTIEKISAIQKEGLAVIDVLEKALMELQKGNTTA